MISYPRLYICSFLPPHTFRIILAYIISNFYELNKLYKNAIPAKTILAV